MLQQRQPRAIEVHARGLQNDRREKGNEGYITTANGANSCERQPQRQGGGRSCASTNRLWRRVRGSWRSAGGALGGKRHELQAKAAEISIRAGERGHDAQLLQERKRVLRGRYMRR